MRDAFMQSRACLSEETWFVFISVLLCGAQILCSRTESTAILRLALDAMFGPFYADGFLRQFDGQLGAVFEARNEFRDVWIEKFERIYKRLLKQRFIPGQGPVSDSLEPHFNFLRSKIDVGFSAAQRHRGFSLAIQCWLKILRARDYKLFAHFAWPTDEIKELFLGWFSISGSWSCADLQWTDVGWHPLFLLIKMGNPETTPDLERLATDLIHRVLQTTIGEETDLYWFLPIYAYDFLIAHRKLLFEIRGDLIEFFDRPHRIDVERSSQIEQYWLLLLMIIYRMDVGAEYQGKVVRIMAKPYRDFAVTLVSIFSLLFADAPALFWQKIGAVLTQEKFEEAHSAIALIAGLAPHLFRESYATDVKIERALWEMIPESNTLTQQRLILALFGLSEGSDFFNRNPDAGGEVLELMSAASLDTSELGVFQRVLRLSLLCGGGSATVDKAYRSRAYVENFATRNYVISVIGENHILIRHGLGCSVYEVEDLFSNRKRPKGIELPMNGHAERLPVSDAYQSLLDTDSEFASAVEQLDSMLSGENEFVKYVPPEPVKNASAAHSLLCDLGFLSADTHEITRRVPPELFDAIEALDETSSCPVAVVFVLQLLKNQFKRELVSIETPTLIRLLQDMSGSDCPVGRFAYVSPALDSACGSCTSQATQTGFVIVLNESGLRINGGCPELGSFDVVLAITPEGDDAYAIDVILHNLTLVGELQLGNFTLLLSRTSISRFVALLVYLYFATPGRTLANGVKGPEHFVGGFHSRTLQISQIFEKSEPGRNAILLGCLSCGLPQ
jgi:hypothetical protein